MPSWVFWVIAAGLLGAGEVLTAGFVLGPIALAALVAALVAVLGGALAVQVLAFALGVIASLLFLRPVAVRHLRTPAALRTGTAALVGARAVVLDRVDQDGGRVKIGGETWSARAYMPDQVLEPGTHAEVAKIEGATALVYE